MHEKLNDLVVYQKGSIVSKTILKKTAGNVSLFAFSEGQELSEHSAPYDALVQIFDGEAEISISGEKSTVKNGEMILLPANKPHAIKACKDFKMILTMLKSENWTVSDCREKVVD